MLKKTLKVLCVLIVAVLVCAVVLIAWLSVTEYKPKAVEKAEIYDSEATGLLDKNESIKILSFNTGYAGLGEEADFFMTESRFSIIPLTARSICIRSILSARIIPIKPMR